MRDYEGLISEQNGTQSRMNAVAAVALLACSFAYYSGAIVAAGGSVSGTAVVAGTDNAATVFAAGKSLELIVGAGNAVVLDFYDSHAAAYAGANHGIDVQTNAAVSLATALAAIQTAVRANGGADAAAFTAAVTATHVKLSAGTVGKTLDVRGDVATLAAIGIADDVYQPVAAEIAGYIPWDGNGDADTVVFVPAATAAGQQFVAFTKGLEIKDAKVEWPADDGQKTALLAALADKEIIVR